MNVSHRVCGGVDEVQQSRQSIQNNNVNQAKDYSQQIEMDKSKIGKRFQGKAAIITASTQGIGFAIAQRLGLEGASVVISSRKQKNVDEATEKLRDQGIEVLDLACHVSNAQQRKNLIDKTVQKYGKIDVIVSNAATNPSVDNLLQTPESILDKLWEINVKASTILLKVGVCYLLAMEHANNLSISPIENIDYDRYTYIYDRGGTELHCLKEHGSVSRLQFLKNHFLLASINKFGQLH